MAAFGVLAALVLLAAATAASEECHDGTTIANSNRDAGHPCSGTLGTECEYSCLPGFQAVGRHVCQQYEGGGKVFIDHAFFGGRCVKLASPWSCAEGQVPVRIPSSEGLRTLCFANGTAALKQLAKGSYEAWRRGRNDRTGLYVDNINAESPTLTNWEQGASGVTGLGLISEAIAAAMGWQTQAEAQERVLLTLRSLAGQTPGCQIPRDANGFWAHYFDSGDCSYWPSSEAAEKRTSCMMCSGLLISGVLFARNYFLEADPGSASTAQIKTLADQLWNSTRFDHLLCEDGVLSTSGTQIPMIHYMQGNKCDALMQYQKDGYYGFNEEHYTVELAYLQACSGQETCTNKAIETMWDRWSGRRLHPNSNYEGIQLLSKWAGYIVQLPYYASHSFNSDEAYVKLFHNHWQADWKFFNETEYAGERGRYGLGAGPTPYWCTEKSRYFADRLDTGSQSHCRIYSPYILAGYLPAEPELVSQQLLQVLFDGEATLELPGDDDLFILWRRSMLDVTWSGGKYVTMVDFSSELFGLSTLYLGTEFFTRHSNYAIRADNRRAIGDDRIFV